MLLLVVSFFMVWDLFAIEGTSLVDNVNIRKVSQGGFFKTSDDSPSIVFMREGATNRYFLEMITSYEMDNLMLFYLGRTKEQVLQCLEYFQQVLEDKDQVVVKDDVKSVYSISYQSESGKNLRFSTKGFIGDGYVSKANIKKFIADIEKFAE